MITDVRDNNDFTYNFLDKPELINIKQGQIKIIYDAEGNKLQKIYTPKGSTTSVTTTYINQYVYKGNELQYINFEEGIIRVIQPFSWNNGYDGASIDGNMALPNGKKGAYDYYIRDYQENVRVILTEETHKSVNQATMESARAANEEPVFGQTGAANEVATTRFGKPPGWTSNTSSSVSKLSKLSGHTIGPNSLLKVMAGDTLNAQADYYYAAPVVNNNNSVITDIVNTLVQAIGSSTTTNPAVKNGAAGINTNLNSSTPFSNTADPNKTTTDNIPRAYLNVMFFDERFNFVAENSTAVRVSQPGTGAAPLVLPANTKAPKNGYAYIYVSNENDDAVYFDNLQVSDNRGRIIEENHYYAFGLKIAGISSVKLPDANEGNINNKNLYNDKELMDDGGLDLYDFGFRIYDPQIGRFTQIDPLTDDMPDFSSYLFAGNEPIANVDVDGLFGGDVVKIGGVLHKAVGPGGGFLNGITKAVTSFAVSVGTNAARIGTEIYKYAKEDELINTAIKNGGEALRLGGRVGGTLVAVLWPSDAIKGGDRPAPKWYELTDKPYSPPKPENEEDDDKKYLIRFGADPESAEKLAEDASQAEKNPRFGHGVSTTLRSRVSGNDRDHRSALLIDVVKYFKVNPSPTLRNPKHVTVILPKPVTREVANKFNSLFKTRR